MTQDTNKQESPKEETPRQEIASDEILDADLDKVSGGAEPVGSKLPKTAQPVNDLR